MSLAHDCRDRLARFNAGDLDGYVDVYSDDVVFGGATAEPTDKAGVRAFRNSLGPS